MTGVLVPVVAPAACACKGIAPAHRISATQNAAVHARNHATTCARTLARTSDPL